MTIPLRHARFLVLLFAFSTTPVNIADTNTPLRVVASVDLQQYAGLWYEIARLPNRFQKQCVNAVTAEYLLRADGTMTVVNRCRLADGRTTEAKGVARVAGPKTPNSMLKVRFAPSFLSFLPQVWGDYQIILLDPGYRHVVVGAPDRKYLWVLARTPEIDEATYGRLLDEAKNQGFDVTRIERTRH